MRSFLLVSNEALLQSIAALRDTGKKLFIVATGATGGLLQEFWGVPGMSQLLLDYHFCYSREALDKFLGFTPESYCDYGTAEKMAARAYWDGMELAVLNGVKDPDIIGVGITAAVATNRHRRGRDAAYVAVRTKDRFIEFQIEFKSCDEDADLKTRTRTRIDQGKLTDVIALNMMLEAAGLPQLPFIAADTTCYWVNKRESEPCVAESLKPSDVHNIMKSLGSDGLNEKTRRFVYNRTWNPRPIFDEKSGDALELLSERPCILFPGSFNPLHYGHIMIAREVEKMTGCTVVYEMTNMHPNKGAILDEEMLRRADQFNCFAPVILSDNAPRYVDKAERYPKTPMIIGVDALEQMLDIRHYQGGRDGMFEALERFGELGTYFYVIGRKTDGVYYTRDDVLIPPRYLHLFRGVSYRADVSSSALRAKAQA